MLLDESGVNIDMTRRYGRAIGKVRVHSGFHPLDRSSNIHHVFRWYNHGSFPRLSEKRADSDASSEQHCYRGQHAVKSCQGRKRNAMRVGVIPLYLPPYNPDLNPMK